MGSLWVVVTMAMADRSINGNSTCPRFSSLREGAVHTHFQHKDNMIGGAIVAVSLERRDVHDGCSRVDDRAHQHACRRSKHSARLSALSVRLAAATRV